MIKFIIRENLLKEFKLKDVSIHQFFVSVDGELCQKNTGGTYNKIANASGRPESQLVPCGDDCVIKEILPTVTKIEF